MEGKIDAKMMPRWEMRVFQEMLFFPSIFNKNGSPVKPEWHLVLILANMKMKRSQMEHTEIPMTSSKL